MCIHLPLIASIKAASKRSDKGRTIEKTETATSRSVHFFHAESIAQCQMLLYRRRKDLRPSTYDCAAYQSAPFLIMVGLVSMHPPRSQ